MASIEFAESTRPTLGVEIEMGLVDRETKALTNVVTDVLEALPEEFKDSVKPELMQCYIEVNSGVCEDVAEVEADLRGKLLAVQDTTDKLGVELFWAGTHPFSRWKDQIITNSDRYLKLVNMLQDTARQLITFGLHVHVGVGSGDKAVMICDRILRHLPTLLAMTGNSPFWEGRRTGLQSWRSKVMEGLPTAGLPPLMRNWSEYVWLVNHLIDTGYIETIREIWWDVRPHHNFGTVEVRICDVPGSLEDVLAVTALVQSLVQYLSDEIDRGTYQHDCHPMLIRQNKWRAARYGLDAELVDSKSFERKPAREILHDMVGILTPISEDLGCADYLKDVGRIADGPTWATRQIEIMEKTEDPKKVVEEFVALSRLH